MSENIKIRRDKNLKYLGVQILYDRYFLRIDDKIMETPQSFFMRVAMGLALNEENKEESTEANSELLTQSASEVSNEGGKKKNKKKAAVDTAPAADKK